MSQNNSMHGKLLICSEKCVPKMVLLNGMLLIFHQKCMITCYRMVLGIELRTVVYSISLCKVLELPGGVQKTYRNP